MAPDPVKEETMGLRINQNIAAMNAYRNLTVTDGQMAKSLEKLSSGFRINRAADDAAGLSISEGLRSQVGGTNAAIRNAQDGISVVQTAEGAMTEVHSVLPTAGYTTDQINAFQVNVTDGDGDGVFKVEFKSNQAFTTADVDAGTLALAGLTAGAQAVSSTGGAFHVGANNASADTIN